MAEGKVEEEPDARRAWVEGLGKRAGSLSIVLVLVDILVVEVAVALFPEVCELVEGAMEAELLPGPTEAVEDLRAWVVPMERGLGPGSDPLRPSVIWEEMDGRRTPAPIAAPIPAIPGVASAELRLVVPVAVTGELDMDARRTSPGQCTWRCSSDSCSETEGTGTLSVLSGNRCGSNLYTKRAVPRRMK